MLCCRIVNGIKNKKHKKQPWGKVECFAFGGATVRFASLETSFHSANHTIPSATLLRGLSTLPQGQKPLAVSRRKTPDNNMISWLYQLSKTILHGRDATLRVRDKWLIFNMVAQLWADVKYHVPTGFGFSPKASGIYPLNRYSIDVNSEDERRWGHKKALGFRKPRAETYDSD